MWNDGPEFEHLLSDPFAEHPVVNRHILNGGGKGGSPSSQPQQVTSTNTTTNLPAYAQPYYQSLLNRAQSESYQPYQAYGGPRLAPFSQPQQQGFDATQANYGIAKNNLNQAQAAASQGAYNPSAVTSSYQANIYNPQQWIDPNVASQYMSPYMQNVVDIQKREANRDFGIQQQARNAAAAAGGAFGGYRQGIVDAEAQRNLNQQLQDIQATGLQNAYQTGLGAFNQDRSALLGANQIANQNLQQQAALGMQAQGATNQYGLQGAAQYLNQAQALQNLGLARQQAGISDINQLFNAGAMQQAQQQNAYDIAYQDFINQRDYPRQSLNWLSGILHGTPVTANAQVTYSQAPPSTVSQLTGLGLGAAGLSKIFS